MGLFPGRRLSRPTEFRSPIRLHSELSLAAVGGLIRGWAQRLRSITIAATNDARVVGAVLLIAAAGLALEMARSFPR